MKLKPQLMPITRDEKPNTIIKLAIMAVGGQGGGVLTSWIEALARQQGYACQATSVAGVSQRTGATIYYIEMAPETTLTPIFSLAPAPGDVDILIAAEMMEAGRAIMRGFVTPDRTTLIASTHRALAVSEKTVPGDGIASSDEVKAAAEIAADQLIMFDLDRVASENGSVISSALFGALAGSGALPFSKEAFEAAIHASKKSVDASLRTFLAAYERTQLGDVDPVRTPAQLSDPVMLKGPDNILKAAQVLIERIKNLPIPAQRMAHLGLRKVLQFQDVNYGAEYLDHLDVLVALDHGNVEYTLSVEAAKYIANAMAYDDIIKVADLKTRRARFERISAEMDAANSPVELTEFFHPRAEEIAGMLPANFGAKFEKKPQWMAQLDRWFSGSRRIRTHRLGSFLILYFLGGLRGYRRRTLRHRHEYNHLTHWLTICRRAAMKDYDLAVELLRSRRLVKGYSDTHARSLSKFDKVLLGAALVEGRSDAANWVARLREAALQDEQGEALDGAIKTLKSFSNAPVDA